MSHYRLKNTISRGFTLIELLVVISIVGLLSSVVLANVHASDIQSDNLYTRNTLHQYIIALEQHVTEFGSFPNDGVPNGSTGYCLGASYCYGGSFPQTPRSALIDSKFMKYMSTLPNVMRKPIIFRDSEGAPLAPFQGMIYGCNNGNPATCQSAFIAFGLQGANQSCSFEPKDLIASIDTLGLQSASATYCYVTLKTN